MPSAASDLPLLEAAAHKAGAIARAAFGSNPKTWDKGANQPVTETDLAIDKMLREELIGARPDYGWLSEESADNAERLKQKRVFIVDPIDGTRAFIAGQPQFTISIGLIEDGRAIAGAVYNPMMERLYLGAEDAGATLNGAPMTTSDRAELAGISIISTKQTLAKTPEPWPDMRLTMRASIANRLALVASARVDAIVLSGFKHEWDVAGGAALIAAAGGAISDPWGRPLRFNQPNPRVPGLVASGPRLHPLLIARTSQFQGLRDDSNAHQESLP